MNVSFYLLISAAMLSIGIYGIITLRHAIKIIMSIELILNSANINFVAFSAVANIGQAFAILVIAVSAAEICVGLAVIYNLYKIEGDVDAMEVDTLKW